MRDDVEAVDTHAQEGLARVESNAIVTHGTDLRWQTPGVVIADAISGLPEVRFVFEKADAGRYTVFAILDDDPDDVLDPIFDAERELFRSCAWVPFDVRVMKVDKDWDPTELASVSIPRHRRS